MLFSIVPLSRTFYFHKGIFAEEYFSIIKKHQCEQMASSHRLQFSQHRGSGVGFLERVECEENLPTAKEGNTFGMALHMLQVFRGWLKKMFKRPVCEVNCFYEWDAVASVTEGALLGKSAEWSAAPAMTAVCPATRLGCFAASASQCLQTSSSTVFRVNRASSRGSDMNQVSSKC